MASAVASVSAANAAADGSAAKYPEQERSPEARRQTSAERRIDELETFVRAMAHDAGALTRGITLRTEWLRERIGQASDHELNSLVDAIAERAERLGRMSEALLRLARVGVIEIERRPIDLSALADEVVADLRRQQPQRTAACIICPGMSAQGDRALVRLLLENLLGNAWKYTARAAATKIEFGCRRNGEEATFYVIDNGIGLCRETASALFSPFVRQTAAQTYPGTGLGLVIAKQIVERHGGWIRADTGSEVGAAFVFSLGITSKCCDSEAAA